MADRLEVRLTELVYENMQMCAGCETNNLSLRRHTCSTLINAFGNVYRVDFFEAVNKSIEQEGLSALPEERLWGVIGKIYQDTFRHYNHI